MRYVQRDEKGVIKGVYANPQPQPDGSCLTDPRPLADDHPDVIAFLTRPIYRGLTDGDLASVLVQQKVIAQSVIDAAVASKSV